MDKKLIIKNTGRKRKFPLAIWLKITSAENKEEVKTMEISYENDEEEIVSAAEKKVTPVFEIRLIETDQPFLAGRPKKNEVIIIKKPRKTDIFISDPKLAKKLAIELNKIKGKWAPDSWYTNQKLTMISALKEISKKKISVKIVPFIEKIMKDFYGDD